MVEVRFFPRQRREKTNNKQARAGDDNISSEQPEGNLECSPSFDRLPSGLPRRASVCLSLRVEDRVVSEAEPPEAGEDQQQAKNIFYTQMFTLPHFDDENTKVRQIPKWEDLRGINERRDTEQEGYLKK